MKYIVIGIIGLIAAVVFYYAHDTYQGQLEAGQVSQGNSSAIVNVETEGNVQVKVIQESDKTASVEETLLDVAGSPEEDSVSGISLDELAQHNNKFDCWVVYNNAVYDVTKFLPFHPGGVERIARYCGTTEFQAAFEAHHGKSKVNQLQNRSGDYQGDLK